MLLALLPVIVFGPLVAGAAPPMRWELLTDAGVRGPATALAVDAASGRIAVGDERGVWLGDGPRSLRRSVRRGPVRDLAFLPDGTLLVATGRGLFALDATQRVSDRSPAPGAKARDVARLAVDGGLVVAGTGAGAFVSEDARVWLRLDARLPHGPTAALAMLARGEDRELWLVVGRELWRTRLRADARPLAMEALSRELPSSQVRSAPLDVLASRGGLLVLTEDLLSLWEGPERGWRVLRPALPPGATPRRLAFAAGRLWIATDRGLLGATHAAGPWRRARGPAASDAISMLVEAGGHVLAAAERGLLLGTPDPSAPATRAPAATLATGPPVAEVQRHAIDYLGLGPGDVHRLRQRVRRRGWLPTLDVRLEADRRRTINHELDEAFSSGALRRLNDRERDRTRDFEMGLLLRWQLGDLVYHPEEIDVSKEAREIVELRDEVLDEVNQLYFERQRVLLDLADQAQDPGRAARLRLRAAELAAGLDAWTGGWFGRQLLAADASAASSRPVEGEP